MMYVAMLLGLRVADSDSRFSWGHMKRGPLHVVAGYTHAILGDYVTACGLTLPLQQVTVSSEDPWVNAPSRCGDCFPAKED